MANAMRPRTPWPPPGARVCVIRGRLPQHGVEVELLKLPFGLHLSLLSNH
jgi:hypothetical protein